MYELHEHRDLDNPILITCLEGWIDAGLGATSALAAIVANIHTEPVATFDVDSLLDHRSRRPLARIVDGVHAGITWPEIQIRCGIGPSSEDVLLLTGPEPDHYWRGFSSAVVKLATDLSVRLAVSLGAFPAPVPHTRPVRLAATSTSQSLAASVGFVAGTIEVPSGMQAVLETALGEAGIPALGLWARVPHYVAGMPYPAASAALIEGLGTVAGISLDTSELQMAADVTRQRIDTVIANSEDHRTMIDQLEAQIDGAEADSGFNFANLPTGDEIAAELERFLRGETQ